ncbi:MAG: SDR family oxidoreductase [Candidatus Kryptoniota bacterium]
MAGTILVSGGSGYIAGFLIRQLVNEGWVVHTTVRNLARESEVRRLINVENVKLKFFAADLMSDDGWANAMAGCSHVAHLASPFPLGVPKNEDDLIIPARDGALRVLRLAKAAGVKRFVMTSSCAAIAYGHDKSAQTFTESDWTVVTSPDVQPYVKSKTIAERAARDWVAAEGGDIEFCTVNPSAVLGPVWSDDISTSTELVKKLLEGALPGCPDIGFSIVDVRDVADMHVQAMNAPNMAGERFICAGQFLKAIEIARILKSKLGAEAKKVPARKLPDFVVKLAAKFDPSVKQIAGEIGKIRNADASHARDVLGWVPRPVEETIIDTARSLIDLGIVKV